MAGTLRTGMEIDLSQSTPSVFGLIYWEKFKRVGIENIPSLQGAYEVQSRLINKAAYREFWLEVFRKDHPEINGLPLKSRLKDPLHNLFFCFPHPIKSTSYKREFVGNWGYAEVP